MDQNQPAETTEKPDEESGILVEARIKIHDPETEEVFVEGRA